MVYIGVYKFPSSSGDNISSKSSMEEKEWTG
jgi:hypothetical protein